MSNSSQKLLSKLDRADLIKWALVDGRRMNGQPGLSYAQLVLMLKEYGIADPKTGEFVNKSRVASYASGRAKAPDWFMSGLQSIVGLPDSWVGSAAQKFATPAPHIAITRTPSTPILPIDANLLTFDPAGWTGPSLKIPVNVEGVAVPIRTLQARPVFSPRDVVVVNTAMRTVSLDRIYAMADAAGKLAFAKAIDHDGEIAFAQPGGKPHLDIAEYEVAGTVVAALFDFDESSEDGEGIFSSKGIRITGW